MPMRETLEALRDLRTRFGPRQRVAKRRWLARAARLPLGDVASLLAYHDILLFIAAYPDDGDILRMVQAELRRVAHTAERVFQAGRQRAIRRLADTGIAGTALSYSFSLDMMGWLTRRFGHSVELEWDDGSLGSDLDEFLAMLTCHVERDGLLSDRFTTRQWFELARGAGRRSDLGWLVERFERLDASPELREQALDRLDLKVRWRLKDPVASRTFARFPGRRAFYQKDKLQRTVGLREWMAQPLSALRGAVFSAASMRKAKLSLAEARPFLDACRVTLCARRREIDTLSYVNEREVSLFHLERGIDLAVFGMRPDRRLPIESYFGFVLARNRVPVGYGGGWVFYDRSEIGVNIFDEFRGGESALLFAQVMRVYHQHLGARRFIVDSYQFGAGNTEAIRSGAFWFYDRLGFRPLDEKLRRLADSERSRIQQDRSYRSPAKVLRRLARSRLVFDMDATGKADKSDFALSDVGIAVTRWIGKRFDGNKQAAERWALRRAVRELNVHGMSTWPTDQRASFRRLCVLLGPISRLSAWSAGEKKALVAVMRAKGGASERTYVWKLRRHARLRAALAELARAR